MIRVALANAGLSAAEVDVVEAHGTGTTLGDPIEAQALLATYGQDRPARSAPVVGIAEVQHWPRSSRRRCRRDHQDDRGDAPRGDAQDLARRCSQQPCRLDCRIGGIAHRGAALAAWRSSPPRRGLRLWHFGTNAHVVLEQAPTLADGDPVISGASDGTPVDAAADDTSTVFGGDVVLPWVLSGRSVEALRAQAARLSAHLQHHPEYDDLDVGWSLVSSRARFEHRAVVVGEDHHHLMAGLTALAEDRAGVGVVEGAAGQGKCGWLFTGQGSQRPGMGRELYETFPVFTEAFDAVCLEMDRLLGSSLAEVVFDSEPGVLDQTMWAQAGLFAVQVGLAVLLRSWGIEPDVVVGHSIGGVVAAHVAGVMSLADACTVVAARGRLMQAARSGGAMSLQASEHEVYPHLDERVCLAAINAPEAVVLSGDEDAVLEVTARLGQRKSRRLTVSHAFHSPHMDSVLDEFEAVLAAVTLQPPTIPVISDSTGELLTDEQATSPQYWSQHFDAPSASPTR